MRPPRLLLLCVPWLPLLAAPPSAPRVTWSGQVAPLVYAKCAGCHRAGEAAPFSLTSYADAAKRAKLLAAVTASRYMPPWPAEPASHAYRDSRRLTEAEVELLAEWARQGAPQGDPARAPAPPSFPQGWQLGTPDLVVELPEAIAVPAEGADLYLSVAVPLGLTADRWVEAIELRPSARSVVHHVLYFADTTGEAHTRPVNRRGTMRFGRGTVPLGGWAVGAQPHRLPEGLGLPLPKGSDLVLQYHLHPTGRAERERSTIGLYFAKRPPARTLAQLQLPPVFGLFSGVEIPAGEARYTVKDSFVLPVDTEAVSVGAHAHYLGKSMRLTATRPDGTVETLLSIPQWDFSWQDRYFFASLVPLPKGTRLDAEVVWDNSAGNPHNPSSPPVAVAWGEQSKDEMGAVALQLVPRQESDAAALKDAIRQHVRKTAISRILQDPGLLARIRERFGADALAGRMQ